MTISRIVPSALLVALVTGCSMFPGGGNLGVAGREFLSTSVTVDGAEQPLVEGTRIRLSFLDDSQLAAYAGCNHFGATYSIDGGVLGVTQVGTTEIGCEPALAEQDAWLFEFLAAQPLITVNADELVLENEVTVLVLVDREVAEPDLALVGPIWTVTGIVSAGAVVSAPEGVVSTLVFTEDGQVMVNTGCNTGTGPAEVLADTIRFGDIALTRVACEGPAADMEQAMTTVLSSDVVRYEIDASALALSIGDIGLQLSGTATE